MAKEYKKGKSSKDKNGGTFTPYYNDEEKITVYESKSGKTAVFKNGKKVNRNY